MRQSFFCAKVKSIYLREQHPLQQGLRLSETHHTDSHCQLREQHPLQQGLRQEKNTIIAMLRNLREQHPLQQGLRLFKPISIVFYHVTARATSITTRIETSTPKPIKTALTTLREQHPLQQGLRHIVVEILTPSTTTCESNIHYNKD